MMARKQRATAMQHVSQNPEYVTSGRKQTARTYRLYLLNEMTTTHNTGPHQGA